VRLSPAEIRKAEEEMEDVQKPQNNLAASRNVNDFMKAPGRSTAPRIDIKAARKAAHDRIREANAAKQS
jgi:hypothetical protein